MMWILMMIASGVAAFFQTVIAIVEICLWRTRRVHQRLDFTQSEANLVAPIVQNAGLYNSFLAAGLIWSMCWASAVPHQAASELHVFCLVCVFVAGVFGAITLKPTTLILQSLPAGAALVANLLLLKKVLA